MTCFALELDVDFRMHNYCEFFHPVVVLISEHGHACLHDPILASHRRVLCKDRKSFETLDQAHATRPASTTAICDHEFVIDLESVRGIARRGACPIDPRQASL